MEKVSINTPTINLDQFLKWAGVTETGGQVKELIAEGMIKVNGVSVTERRKKLHPGDLVAIEGVGSWMVSKE